VLDHADYCAGQVKRPGVIHIRQPGRFLEHHRVYWFGNDGTPDLFCASADWLERNLLRRVETGFPILDPANAARVYDEALANYLDDNVSAWQLQPDGDYVRVVPAAGSAPHSAQSCLLAKLCG